MGGDRGGGHRGGIRSWFLLDPKDGKVLESATAIWPTVRCGTSEPRIMTLDADGFAAARKQMESYSNRTYMRQANPPIGVNPRLITWMALG